MKTCLVEGCNTVLDARGLCPMHWKRHKKAGTLSEFPKQNVSSEEKLRDVLKFVWENSEQIPWTGCWIWLKSFIKGGYACTCLKGATVTISRLVLGIHNDSPETQALHKCDNPMCVNPDHLFIGSAQDNMEDMVQKGRMNFRAILTERDVLNIREEHARSGCIHKSLAEKYGVARNTISALLKRTTWTHI